MPTDAGNKAGCGRVYDNILNPSFPCQLLQRQVVFLIGELPVLLSTVPIILLDAVPAFRYTITFIVQMSRHSTPQSHRHRVECAIVTGYVILIVWTILRWNNVIILVKHWIYRSLCFDPFTQDKSLIKHSAVQAFIFRTLFRADGEVILHGKVLVKYFLLFLFIFRRNPFFVKPVFWILWIAVKPKSATFHGAARHCLLYKRLRHQCYLIK